MTDEIDEETQRLIDKYISKKGDFIPSGTKNNNPELASKARKILEELNIESSTA